MPTKTCARTSLALLGGSAAALSWIRGATTAHEPPFDAIPWITASVAGLAIVAGRLLSRAPDAHPRRDESASSRRLRLVALTIGCGLLVGLYGPVLALPFLNEEDLFHLTVVRHPQRVGMGPALGEALRYLGSHPATIVQSLVFVPWWTIDAVVGDAPWGYRLASLALHASMALLTIRTARMVGLGEASALGAGLLLLVATVARPVVRDPTGLPELMAGVIYLALLTLWVPRLEGRPASATATVLAYALLPAAVLTKPVLASLPLVVFAFLALRRTGDAPRNGRAMLTRAAPLLAVALAQVALVAWQFEIDPTSGRTDPSHPEAEYGLVAEASRPAPLATALAANLPRSLLFPAWDHAPQAHWSGAIAAGLAGLALLGLGRDRRGVTAVLCGGSLTIGAALPGLAFTGDEGPVNAHLLYTAGAGAAITAAAWVASLPRRGAIAAALLLSAWCGSALALHGSALREERAEARRLDRARSAFDRLDDGFAAEAPVTLLSGSDAATNRWRYLVLSRHARGLGPRAAYRIETGVTLLEGDGTGTPPSPSARPGEVRLAWVGGRVAQLGPQAAVPDDLPRIPPHAPRECTGATLAAIQGRGWLCAEGKPESLHPIERLLAEM